MYLSKIYAKSPILILAMFWAMLPLGQFLVGLIFETRLVPLWKGQARVFFPGDLAIGIMMVGLVGLYAKYPLGIDEKYVIIWHIIALLAAFLFFIIFRSNDAANYPKLSANSPTKWYHDICGYLISFYFILSFSLPQLYQAIRGKSHFCSSWVIFIAGLALYGICLAYDTHHGYTDADVLARHPENWKPFWR